MSSNSPVAGVSLTPGGPLIWALSDQRELPPGCLCLLTTPEGERSARLVVPPQLLRKPVEYQQGYILQRGLTEAEALVYEPAASLTQQLARKLGNWPGVRAHVTPDGSNVTLLAERPPAVTGLATAIMVRFQVPVVVRDQSGELPGRVLPGLLDEIAFGGESVTVQRISVFRGEITLRRAGGNELTVPLESVSRDSTDL